MLLQKVDVSLKSAAFVFPFLQFELSFQKKIDWLRKFNWRYRDFSVFVTNVVGKIMFSSFCFIFFSIVAVT